MCVGCLIGELPMKNVNTSMQILFFLNNFRNFLYCSPKVSITLFKFCKRLLCLQFYGFVFISVYADVLFISRTAQRVCVPVVPESPTAALGRPKRKQTVSKRKKSNMYQSMQGCRKRGGWGDVSQPHPPQSFADQLTLSQSGGAQCVELALRWQFCVHSRICHEIYF